MYYDNKIWIGSAQDKKVCILPRMANRHGLIAGATGTGKTVTLKVLAESFSDAGTPVFLADVKGDLSGICRPGVDSEDMQKRIHTLGLEECGFHYQSFPAVFWDIYGKGGIPLRTTISEIGPVLLAKILGLNDTQTDVLTVVFKIADDNGLLLIDTKDLKAMLRYVEENSKELAAEYGNLAPQSIGALTRRLVALESQGGEQFFSEPALSIIDWFSLGEGGRGNINILDCRSLVGSPALYSAFLLWMLSELFETLPEVGDPEKPRMVFFFDEAHLLFDGISKTLEDKIEQVVKLIRSKGVGVYFITQNPSDIPDGVLGQLGNKIQHALHAYTPAEMKAVKTAAATFRPNPAFDTLDALTSLGIGEALVSTLDESGIPGIVERCTILPPQSLMGPISDADRLTEAKNSLLYLKYQNMVDRDSAYEFLQRQQKQDALLAQQQKQEELSRKAADQEAAKAAKEAEKEAARAAKEAEREAARAAKEAEKEAQRKAKEEEKRRKEVASSIGRVASTAAGTIGREVGNTLGESLGGSFGKRLGGNVGAQLGRSILGTLFKR